MSNLKNNDQKNAQSTIRWINKTNKNKSSNYLSPLKNLKFTDSDISQRNLKKFNFKMNNFFVICYLLVKDPRIENEVEKLKKGQRRKAKIRVKLLSNEIYLQFFVYSLD